MTFSQGGLCDSPSKGGQLWEPEGWPQVALPCLLDVGYCRALLPEMNSPWPFIITTGNLITGLSEKERLIYNRDFVMKV